jgi:hypothetical protein
MRLEQNDKELNSWYSSSLTINEFGCDLLEVLVRSRSLEDLEGLDASSHG